MSGAAAGLGSVCHETMEAWVESQPDDELGPVPPHYKRFYPVEWDVMKGIYDEVYWRYFADKSKYDEGVRLMKSWLKRQDWSDREVISTELKKTIMLKTSVGEIPFNYIMDRKDRIISSGDIQVIDYKTLVMPVQPAEVKDKIQGRAYALAAQLEHPEAPRIWVIFDMLRYEAVGVLFTIEENRATWRYLHALVERIIADEDPKEKLGEGCRFCIRKSVCKTLQAHADVGGPLGITDPHEAAIQFYKYSKAVKAIEIHMAELQAVVEAFMAEKEIAAFEMDDYTVAAAVTGRRVVDDERVITIVGEHIFARYSSAGIGRVEDMLKNDPDLTDDQKSRVQQAIRKNYGAPQLKIKPKPVV